MKKISLLLSAALLCLLLAIGITAAAMPTLTGNAVAYVAYHSGAGGNDENTGLTVDAPRKTLASALELLPSEGGTVVVKNKVYIGGDYTMPAYSGALLITSDYGDVDYTSTSLAGAAANGVTNNVFKMAAGATLTFTSDTILDNLVLYNEYAKYNTLRVTNGATLVIGEGVVCPGNPDLYSPAYMAIEVDRGATVILNGGTFSSIRGEGTCINNGATISNMPRDCDRVVVYISYGSGSDTNDGLSATSPKQTMAMTGTIGAAALLKNGGGILVATGKIFLGASCSLPNCKGTVRITSKNGDRDYLDIYPTYNPATSLKMAAGAVLTLQSDVILENLVLFNEYSAANTIKVTNGATLVVGSNVICMTNPNLSTPTYMNIEVEKGATVILKSGIFGNVTGEGRILNSGATIFNHTHAKNAGLTTAEATCTESGRIEYACKTCSYSMGTDTIAALRHDYDLSVAEVPATCTAPGTTAIYICSRCFNERGGGEIPATGHSPGGWVVTVAPQPGVYGQETCYCTRCNTPLETRQTAMLPTVQEQYMIQVLVLSALLKSDYTVRFDTRGGSAIPSQKLESGERVTMPQMPVRDGYVFDGWYSDAALWFPYDFSKSVRKNMTLHAKWVPSNTPT